ncbi:MAG: rhomboid family intramembrane serine protease [Desulfatibacillaceae bacterium]
MLPIRDTIESKNYPVVNNLLIVVNILVYVYQVALGPDQSGLLMNHGLVPARFSHPAADQYFTQTENILTLFTFMFLHGGLWHLIANMWSLYIFGDNVEDRLGHLRYLVFYVICGMASGGAHLASNWTSTMPTIGASGAIAGVMGAYFLLYPHSRILTLIPIIIIPYFIELPAFIFLGIWLLFQFLSATGGAATGVAWWAHIGGFVFGMIFLQIAARTPSIGVSDRVRQSTVRRASPRLQLVRPHPGPDEANLYGQLELSPEEAANGARKLINIPWGYQKRLFQVVVPPGMGTGMNLRLRGMGRRTSGGSAGDMILRIVVRDPREAW